MVPMLPCLRRVLCCPRVHRMMRQSEADHQRQSTMSGTGMTQEMEMLAFEGSQGVELTDEEAEESARAYDEAQVLLKTEHDRNPAKTA